ncbi:MAG: hypothetical protein ACRCTG_10975 [Aestuariivirga sp.]
MGRRAVTETDFDEGEETGEVATTMQVPGTRHCHAPGRKHRFCSQYPVRGEDYCKKHMVMNPAHEAAPPARVVANRDPVVVGDLAYATDLEHAIGQLRGDLAVLERAQEIVNSMRA